MDKKISLNRKLAVISAVVLFASGWGIGHVVTGATDVPTDQPIDLSATLRKDEELPRYETFISPMGAECLRDNRKGSLSCNYVKLEAAIGACEASQLAKNTFLNKDGETVVFPLIAGECEAKVKREAIQALALEEDYRRKGY